MRSISIGKIPKWMILFLGIVIAALPDLAAADDGMESQDMYEASFCQTNMTNILPSPYNNISYPVCKRVWNSYVIRYTLTKDRVLTVILSTIYTTGWVGIGFSRDGLMVGSSAMVGWINEDGVPGIKQYYIFGMDAENVLPDTGELQFTGVPAAAVLHEGSIYLAFQIKLENPQEKQNILLAYGVNYPTKNFQLTRHDDQTTLKVDFNSGSKVKFENLSEPRRTHGFLGILGWGLFLPVGAIIARYFRDKDPLWLYLHIVIQSIGYLLIIASMMTGVASYWRSPSALIANSPRHRPLGLFAFTLATLQMLAVLIRPERESILRKYWNWCHHWVGRAGLFCGMVNIMLGIQIEDRTYELKIGYGFLLCFTLVAIAILESLSYFSRREAKANLPHTIPMNQIE